MFRKGFKTFQMFFWTKGQFLKPHIGCVSWNGIHGLPKSVNVETWKKVDKVFFDVVVFLVTCYATL